jgi:ABC-type transport system involved in multi-copper enzyme maturation permease subunit
MSLIYFGDDEREARTMARRIGLGPVFAFEWLVASRRWRGYALRSLFVLGLLISLGVVYQSRADRINGTSLRNQAAAGEAFFYGIVSVQLALIMLAAPAATAGSICLDKARGTLQHVLVTDLSDAEIVLGKLAARLTPTLMLVGCTLPVMALGTLMGGIDPVALTGAFLIACGVAVLGCALALTLSVWGKKTQEVLMATYAFWVVWLLASPMSHQARAYLPGWMTWPLDQMEAWDPFRLAFGPYVRPGSVTLIDDLIFLAGTGLLSVALTALSVWRMRPVALRDLGRGATRSRWPSWLIGARVRAWLRQLGPGLDLNPVLWREWYRNNPSRWTAVLWAVYLVGASLFTIIAWISPGGVAAWVNGLQVSVGLLLLSISAATSLAEERTRGSLDVLLTTPLSTREIVAGKWLGACRVVPVLAFLPAVAVLPSMFDFSSSNTLDTYARELSLGALVCLILAQGAAIVSLGLGLATWVPKLGRAVALTVSAHVMMTVGWLFLCLLIFNHREFEGIAMASPFFGAGNLTFWMSEPRGGSRDHLVPFWGWAWVVVYAGAALVLIVAVLATFNRCLGRIEGPLAPSRPKFVSPKRAFLSEEWDMVPAGAVEAT